MTTRYRITTPVLDYTGVVGNCAFAHGRYEGPVEPGPLAYFTAQGYGVEELPDEPESAGEQAESSLGLARPAKSASKADWVVYAVSQGMDQVEAEKVTRDELVAKFGQEGEQK